MRFIGLIFGFGFFILCGLKLLDLKPMPVSSLDHALNDQVGYVSGARSFLERGVIETTSIFPSTLAQKTKTKILYVPGHYLALAGSFSFFGINFLSSILPSLLGYLGVILAAYFSGKKLFGNKASLWASFLVMGFPFFLFFSLTAMAELEVIASTFMVFAVYLYVPSAFRKLIAPILAVIPIFFRETSILVIFPMAAMIWKEAEPKRKWSESGSFLLVTFILFFGLLKGPLGGRPDLIRANVFGSFSEIYTDALFGGSFNPTLPEWVSALAKHFWGNLKFLLQDKSLTGEALVSKFLLIFSIIVFLAGWKKKEGLQLSIGFMGLVLWAAILGIYAVTGYRGLRVSLVLVPFFALVVSGWLSEFSRFRFQMFFLGLVFIGLSFKVGFLDLVKDFNQDRIRELEIIRFIDDKVHPDKTKVFVAPFWLVSPWLNQNYPAKWAFLPANIETFKLLQKFSPVGTLLLHDSELAVLSLQALDSLGFKKSEETVFEGQKYFILKVPGSF
jgi:hypothetical protein